jgi:hypothetical protein
VLADGGLRLPHPIEGLRRRHHQRQAGAIGYAVLPHDVAPQRLPGRLQMTGGLSGVMVGRVYDGMARLVAITASGY